MSRPNSKVEAMFNNPMTYPVNRLRMMVTDGLIDPSDLEVLAESYHALMTELMRVVAQYDTEYSDEDLRKELGL